MLRLSKRIDPDFVAILVLLTLGLIAYSNSFLTTFHYDDFTRIIENDAIFDLSNLGRIYSYCKQRYLTYLTLAINYKISRFDPTSYHIFNFFIHYFAALFLYFLVIETWKTPAMKESEPGSPLRVAAFLTAGIFFLHPLQTQAVTYIIQRAESMAGMFYLGAVLFYVKARLSESRHGIRGYYLLMILCGLAAAFSKEIAVTLPITIAIYELFFFNTPLRDLLRNKIMITLIIPAGIIVAYKIGMLIERDFYHDLNVPYTRKQYFFTQFSVLLTYLQLFFWPANQNLDWDYPVAVTFFQTRTVSSFFLLLLLILLAVLAYKKYRLLSFGIIGFFVTLAPTSSVIPIMDLMYEHRMYLAVGFLAMGSVQILSRGFVELKRLSPRRYKISSVLFILTLLPLLTGLTYARNQVWANELTLWQDVVEKSPNKVRPHINYGKALYGYSWGDVKEVKREFEIARTLCPECSMAYHNLAFIYWKEGDSETAIELYREALKRAPDYKEALYQSGKLYKELNQWHEARINLERLVKLSLGYQFVPAYLDLIDVYLELGLRNEALQLAEIMTRIPDGLPSLDYYRGLAFYKLQDFAEAKSYFTRQAARGTKLHSTCLMLGQIHYLEGDYDQAEAAFGRAIEVSPWSAMAHSNLAMVLEKRGRLAEASEHLEKARAVQPFSIDTTIRLVVLYDRLGDLSRRTELLRKLLRLNPNSSNFAYLKANMNRDLSQTLNGYAKRFLSGDGSSDTLEALAIIATLREDFGTAIRQYEAYLETLNNQSKKQRVAKEVLRLERLLSGEETLRTPV